MRCELPGTSYDSGPLRVSANRQPVCSTTRIAIHMEHSRTKQQLNPSCLSEGCYFKIQCMGCHAFFNTSSGAHTWKMTHTKHGRLFRRQTLQERWARTRQALVNARELADDVAELARGGAPARQVQRQLK